MSIFLETNHLFLRAPDGGVEDAGNMGRNGFGAIFCNIGDYPLERWDLVRERAEASHVVCGPWLRTSDESNEFLPDKLLQLLETAEAWGDTPFIVNSESELKGSGSELTKYIAEMCEGHDWALSMEPWPFDNVDWTPIKVPVLPQVFGPQWGQDSADVRSQWQAYGVNCVVHTFGTYSGWGPELYDLRSPYGLYTADDCGNDFYPWAPRGECEPCGDLPPPTNGGTVSNDIPPVSATDIIGTEHGITAMVDWLQKQPGMPVRNEKYNASKPGTWPWPERLERTLKILAAEHDAALEGEVVADE